MKTNWYLVALSWLAGLPIIIGIILVIKGQASDDGLISAPADMGEVWTGAGLLSFGLLCVVAALVAGAIAHEIRWSTSLLTARAHAEPVERPKPAARPFKPARKEQPFHWTD